MAIQIKPFEGKDDERLGQLEPNGAIRQWPELDVTGREYSTPATTITMPGGQHFVVLPPGSNAVQLIEQVKAEYEALSSPPAKSYPQQAPAAPVKSTENDGGK